MSCAALSAGRPQIIVPMYHETKLIGEKLRRIGVGYLLSPEDARSGNINNILSEAVESKTMMERTQTVAHSIHARGRYRFLETCVETCEKILAG